LRSSGSAPTRSIVELDDAVLDRVVGRRSSRVAPDDAVPGDVIALPPTQHARLVEPAVEHRKVLVDEQAERDP